MYEKAAEISEGLLRKDPAALEALMDRYSSSVYSLVLRVLQGTGGKQDVEECVSDVFVSAWTRIEEYSPAKGTLRVWLHILAKYKALDYRRKLTGLTEAVSLDERLQSEVSAEREALANLGAEEVLGLVERLAPLDRAIFKRRYLWYEPLETIASALDLSRKAVENRLRRARQELRGMIENMEGSE